MRSSILGAIALLGLARGTTWFSDRPRREAGRITTRSLLRLLRRNDRRRTARFRVRVLDGLGPGLSRLNRRLDRRLPKRFAGASNGAVLSIAEHPALFELWGTQFGGDGQQTFRAPNLQPPLPGMSWQVCAEGASLNVHRMPGFVYLACVYGDDDPSALLEPATTSHRSTCSPRSATDAYVSGGQPLPVSQNTALFQLLGTAYGGDAYSFFETPNVPSPDARLSYRTAAYGLYPEG